MTVYAPRRSPFDRAANPSAFEIGRGADIDAGRPQAALSLGQARRALTGIVRDSYGGRLGVPQLRVSTSLRSEGYAGWYSPDDRSITIAVEILADPVRCIEVLQHEAAHHADRVLDGAGGHSESWRRHHDLVSRGRPYVPATATRMTAVPGAATATDAGTARPFVRGTRSWRFHGFVDCQGQDCDVHGGAQADAMRAAARSGVITRAYGHGGMLR